MNTPAAIDAGATPSRRQRFVAALALGLAAAAFVGFALPLSLYLGNRAEFVASWPTLLAPILPVAVVAALAFAAVVATLPGRDVPGAMVLAATLCLLAWAQSNLLVWEYGLFDGSQIDWRQDAWRGWVDAGLWIGALLLTYGFRHRLVRVLPRVAIVVCLLQALVVGASLLNAPGQAPASAAGDAEATLAQFSAEGNVLHILGDGLQTDVFEDLLAEDGGALGRELDGFVFFEDHLGAFPYTHMAVPAMLGGRAYDNSQVQSRFLADTLGHGSILGAARAAGYDVEVGIPAGGLSVVYGHAVDARLLTLPQDPPVASSGPNQEALLLADLTLFRLLPHHGKRLVYNDQSWLLQSTIGEPITVGRQYLAHEAFLHALAMRMTATRERPTYKMVHAMLSHRPMVMNRDCSFAGQALPMDRANVGHQARCGLGAVRAMLARMRELGIYDDATIVITGDHGAFVTPAALASGTPGLAEAIRRNLPPVLVGQARPLFLVKPPRAKGPLRISSAPSAMTDVPATIADAAGIPGTFPGTSALRLADAPRERRFHYYVYDRSNWTAEYLPEIVEFTVTGRSDDIATWQVSRAYTAPAATNAR